MLETTYGGFRHFLKEFFAYDNFREQMTSILCYLVGVIALCAFFRVISLFADIGLAGPNRSFLLPCTRYVCMYVSKHMGVLYPLLIF